MALQASGSISFSQIANEFGTPSGRNLGAYRVSQTVGSLVNLPLDAGIPQSGTIRFSDFYNKRLNMVVPFGGTQFRVNARANYNAGGGNVVVIGGFRGRPANSSGTKVFANVFGTVGSVNSDDTRYVAFRTGGWDSGTTLQVDVAGSIFGAGGYGGVGGSECEGRANGTGGGNGTSAIGVEYGGTAIINRGYIQCGFGGGGGGGCGSSDPDKNQRDFGAAGGGGGGGAGYPIGPGNRGGFGCVVGIRPVAGGGGGGNSSATVRGGGGGGGSNPGCSGGAGGPGGMPGAGQGGGGGGSGNTGPIGGGGGAGGNGYAIVSAVGGSYSFSNFATVHGGTVFAAVL